MDEESGPTREKQGGTGDLSAGDGEHVGYQLVRRHRRIQNLLGTGVSDLSSAGWCSDNHPLRRRHKTAPEGRYHSSQNALSRIQATQKIRGIHTMTTLTRDHKEGLIESLTDDPEFARVLLAEAAGIFLNGEADMAG